MMSKRLSDVCKKKIPVFHLSVVIFFWSFGMKTSKIGARVPQRCPQFSSFYYCCFAVKRSAFFTDLYTHYSNCRVLCGSCESWTGLNFSVVILFWSFGIIDSNTFTVEDRLQVYNLSRWDVLHFSFSLMNRLNQTGSAVLTFYFFSRNLSCSRFL
jgi:hypothetical protein